MPLAKELEFCICRVSQKQGFFSKQFQKLSSEMGRFEVIDKYLPSKF